MTSLQAWDSPDKDKMGGPTKFSNWVVKGNLIAGAYPGDRQEPSHSEIIKSIIDAGITTFVCLQTENELKSFRPYKEIALKFNKDLQFMHFPIVDQGIGVDEEVLKLTREIADRIAKGEKIYVHCWGGHGRTGTIIALLLVRIYNIEASKALELTSQYHSCRKVVKSSSPQHVTQFEQVRRLAPLILKENEQKSKVDA